MKLNDPVAKSVNTRRKARGLTMRDLEQRTQELALSDSDRFDVVSRGTISNLENEGVNFFRDRAYPMSSKKLATIIELLYDGDAQLWVMETGMPARMLTTEDIDLLKPKPLYVEGSTVRVQDVRSGERPDRTQVPDLPWADLLLEITSQDNVPVVWPGQIVGITLARTPVHRGLNLIVRQGALVLAWEVRTGEYASTAGGGSFGLGPRDAVVGHVRWVTPQLPMPERKAS